jgi:hypothetical protein
MVNPDQRFISKKHLSSEAYFYILGTNKIKAYFMQTEKIFNQDGNSINQ